MAVARSDEVHVDLGAQVDPAHRPGAPAWSGRSPRSGPRAGLRRRAARRRGARPAGGPRPASPCSRRRARPSRASTSVVVGNRPRGAGRSAAARRGEPAGSRARRSASTTPTRRRDGSGRSSSTGRPPSRGAAPTAAATPAAGGGGGSRRRRGRPGPGPRAARRSSAAAGGLFAFTPRAAPAPRGRPPGSDDLRTAARDDLVALGDDVRAIDIDIEQRRRRPARPRCARASPWSATTRPRRRSTARAARRTSGPSRRRSRRGARDGGGQGAPRGPRAARAPAAVLLRPAPRAVGRATSSGRRRAGGRAPSRLRGRRRCASSAGEEPQHARVLVGRPPMPYCGAVVLRALRRRLLRRLRRRRLLPGSCSDALGGSAGRPPAPLGGGWGDGGDGGGGGDWGGGASVAATSAGISAAAADFGRRRQTRLTRPSGRSPQQPKRLGKPLVESTADGASVPGMSSRELEAAKSPGSSRRWRWSRPARRCARASTTSSMRAPAA